MSYHKAAVWLRAGTIKPPNKAHPQAQHYPPGIKGHQGTKIRSVLEQISERPWWPWTGRTMSTKQKNY